MKPADGRGPGRPPHPPRRSARFDFSPLRIAAVYAVLGALWIIWSDSAVLSVVRDREALSRMQTAKGWFFVLASAVLIYALVRRRVRALGDAERAERASRETLEALIEASPYAIVTLDREGCVESWNAAAELTFGPPAAQALGRPFLGTAEDDDAVVRAKSLPRAQALFTQALDGTAAAAVVTLAPRPGAGARDVRLAFGPVRGGDGSDDEHRMRPIRGAVVLARDVTAERNVERERERLVTILDATSDLVAVISPDFKLRYLNAAGRRLLGIGDDEPLDRFHSAQFVADADEEARQRRMREATDAGVLELDRTLRRTDGTTVPVSQVLVIHKGDDGEVEFIATIARDMSERRRQEAALRQSQKMEAVGRLAGGVAHDFNNLLTVILGCAELLRATLPPEGPGRDEAGEIVQAAGRAARLTRQLLAYSRQQVMAVDTVDVNAVVRDLLAMLRRLVGDHVVIVEALDDHTPPVRVDRGQFEQVIVNLVINARDAMPGGGTVTLRSWPLQLSGRPAAGLEVRDTGSGMDEATRAQAFEPFFTTKGLGGGTGLGLATVYGIVKQSGGEITVESSPGAGAAFRVVLPSEQGAAPGEPPQRPPVPTPAAGVAAGDPPPVARRPTRILVVEDEERVRSMTARMLREDGYEVEEADSAREALRLVRDRGDVSLVLTDVEMPEVGGRELAVQLSASGSPARVVFMSGYTNDALLLRGSLPPQASFLAKPFTGVALRQAVRKALDG